jgi:hypothetical protein
MDRAAMADAAGGKRDTTRADDLARRARMSDEDQGPVIDALKAWFAGHPECSDLAEAISALGLPSMDGIPEDRGVRTASQQRAAGAARDVLQHARYALNCRDNPLPARQEAAPDAEDGQ